MVLMNHECEIHLKNEEVYFLPPRTRFQRFTEFCRPIFMASMKNPRAYRYLRNHSTIIQERQRHLRNHIHIIHCFSLFRHWWEYLMLLILVASLLFIPYQAAFDMSRARMSIWTLGKNILLLICCVDVFFNFITGYFDQTRRIVEMNIRLIAKEYVLHSTFIADFFGSLPTDLLFLSSWKQLAVARELSSLVHILRIFSTRSYILKVTEACNVTRGYIGVLTFVPMFIICLHWVACISWIVPIATGSINVIEMPDQMSWISINDLWTKGNQQRYCECLMRAITIISRAGFLTSEPTTDEDQYIAVVMQVLGILVFCYVVSQAMRLFKADNSSILKYQATVAQLKQYMRHKQLPKSVQQRFLAYYEFRYQENYFRESEILQTLSSQMRQEIGMHSCRKLVENVTFFNNLPVSLLTRIVAQLKSEIFLTNDVILRSGQSGDCMYFIATGTVAIYTDSGKEVCHLEDGAHFGEIALVMPDEHRVATVIAVEMCELYRLERSDFMRTIYPYPMLYERIKSIAVERHEKTMIINAR